MNISAPTSERLGLSVRFATDSAWVGDFPAHRLDLPLLAGEPSETILAGSRLAGSSAGFTLQATRHLLAGFRADSIGVDLASQTESIYRDLIFALEGRHLYRVWNYVPAINEELNGLENYRAFCLGRARAFESAFGANYKSMVPSASAVGSKGAALGVVFVAGDQPPKHFENPAQIPAYEYPSEHGPRAPSFARATTVEVGQERFIFISGTAAIKGHATVSAYALEDQICCTLDNLRLISQEVGLGARLGRSQKLSRYFKVYLRSAKDVVSVSERLRRELLQPDDKVSFLQADICRAALNIEIEVTLRSRV